MQRHASESGLHHEDNGASRRPCSSRTLLLKRVAYGRVRLQYVIDPSVGTAAFRASKRYLLLEFADVASINTSNPNVQVAEITTIFPIVLAARP